MKHAQAVNDFFLFSPALNSTLLHCLQFQDPAPDPSSLAFLADKRGCIIWREILG